MIHETEEDTREADVCVKSPLQLSSVWNNKSESLRTKEKLYCGFLSQKCFSMKAFRTKNLYANSNVWVLLLYNQTVLLKKKEEKEPLFLIKWPKMESRWK